MASAKTLSVCLAVCLAATAFGGEEAFPFSIPWSDSSAGVATDVSFLNVKPAGANGRIVVKDGHYVESETGRRVRFLGVNMAGGECFPEHDEAEKIAAHLAKAGYNAVRLHHFHTGWSKTLIDKSFKDTQHIDPFQLDNFEYLIAQLKKNGIYINVGLKTIRELTPEDGIPASVRDVAKNFFSKKVDRFNERWIELQKDFARKLLTHVNPYTKLPLASDPAVIAVEFNNENSILNFQGRSELSELPAFFREELKTKWNVWLKAKYGSDAELDKAWRSASKPLGASLLSPLSRWVRESQGQSQTSLAQLPAEANDAAAPIALSVSKTDSTDWHIQTHLPGLDLVEGETYTLSFKVRSEAPWKGRAVVNIDRPDWHNCGLDAIFESGSEWTAKSYSFTAIGTEPGHVRASFILGASGTGKIELSDVKLRPGVESPGLRSGESLAEGTASIAGAESSPSCRADWQSFLVELDRKFGDTMRDCLVNELGVKAPLIDSQVEYGGLSGLSREAKSDFIDSHAYWQHPEFPGRQWDNANWSIVNTPQIDAIAKGAFNELTRLAQRRVAGKPFSVSEYDHPAPSDFAVEMMPELAVAASLQDWDAIYLFCHGPYGKGRENSRIESYFDQTNHPGKFGFAPAAALLFRGGMLSPLPEIATLKLPDSPWLKFNDFASAWTKACPSESAKDLLRRRLQISQEFLPPGATASASSSVQDAKLPKADASARMNGEHALLSASGDGFATLSGEIGPEAVKAGALEASSSNGKGVFASLMLAACDLKPVGKSSRLLLTIGGRFENQGMAWNATRTSVGAKWGKGPAVAQFIPLSVKVATGRPMKVFALDGTGARTGQAEASFSNGCVSFSSTPAHKTIWYEIAEK